MTTTQQARPELKCDKCGGPNVVWFAPNDLWNAAVGSPYGILCPTCFIRMADEKSGEKIWSVAPSQPQAAQQVTREELAKVLWDYFCPGIRMQECDVSAYLGAASAVRMFFISRGIHLGDERDDVQNFIDQNASRGLVKEG